MQKIVWLLVAAFAPLWLQAAAFHVLIGADTAAHDVRESATIDTKHMRHAADYIAKCTNMSLKMKVLKGKTLTKNRIVKWLKTSNVSSNDVLLFYFTGHGLGSKASKSPWPVLHFKHKSQNMPLEDIDAILKKKGARLTLIFCDACNNFDPRIFKTRAHRSLPMKKPELEGKEALKKLFMRTSGKIVASGSVRGGISFGNEKGGFFTNSILIALQHELNASKPSWKHIFSEARDLVKGFQQPQFKLSIKE